MLIQWGKKMTLPPRVKKASRSSMHCPADTAILRGLWRKQGGAATISGSEAATDLVTAPVEREVYVSDMTSPASCR